MQWIIQKKNLFPIFAFMMFVLCHQNGPICIFSIVFLSLGLIESSSDQITIKIRIEQQTISIAIYLLVLSSSLAISRQQ